MLKPDNSRERSVFTLGGMLTYSRYYMRPVDQENKKRMLALCGQSAIAPLDEYLGLANLPFLISCEAAIQICRIALDAPSYGAAETVIQRRFRVCRRPCSAASRAAFSGHAGPRFPASILRTTSRAKPCRQSGCFYEF